MNRSFYFINGVQSLVHEYQRLIHEYQRLINGVQSLVYEYLSKIHPVFSDFRVSPDKINQRMSMIMHNRIFTTLFLTLFLATTPQFVVAQNNIE
ncbi:MAG: hypothetical protein V7K69_00410 [Nostoc sp.]